MLPFNLCKSEVPIVAITTPASKNNIDLKKLWENKWYSAAIPCPRPIAIYMRPIWEIVEKARIFFMSFSLYAIIEPTNVETRPI